MNPIHIGSRMSIEDVQERCLHFTYLEKKRHNSNKKFQQFNAEFMDNVNRVKKLTCAPTAQPEIHGTTARDEKLVGENGENGENDDVRDRVEYRVDEAMDDLVDNPIDVIIRDIHKKLVLITHPDKGGDRESFEYVQVAFHEKSVMKLLKMASIHSYFPESVLGLDSHVLDAEIVNMQKDISGIESSVAWSWGHTTTDAEKQLLMERFLVYDHIRMKVNNM